VERRISMYSSRWLSFFGRPRLGIQLLYQQKRVVCQDHSVIAFANATTNHKTIKRVANHKRSFYGEFSDRSRNLDNISGSCSHA
jgi:hypothetical protein